MLVRSKPNGTLIGEAKVNDDLRIVVRYVNVNGGEASDTEYSVVCRDAFRADWEIL